MSVTSEYSIYLIRCGDGTLYTGIATDVERRIAEHKDSVKGAKYLRGRGPLELVFQKTIGDRSLATRIEHRIKRLPRAQKQDLKRLPRTIDQLLQQMANQ